MTAGCRVLSPLCFTHSLPPSLSPSLPLQSALHWEKHVEENCKCAELCECVYPECVCVSGRRGSNAGEEIGITRGSACIAPPSVHCMYVCVWVCMYVCAPCNAEQGKPPPPPPRPPPRWDYVVPQGSVASRGAWRGIRPAESGMKGRSCWESGTIRSLCNSGCLSKLNQGQYSYG